MNLTIRKYKGAGVLYHDKEITCIKNKDNNLEVYRNSKLLISKYILPRTNQIGRYPEGVYYFENKNTHFVPFEETKNIVNAEGKFYYRITPVYEAHTSLETRALITVKSENTIEIPICKRGNEKIFLDEGVVQINKETKDLIFNDILQNGAKLWRNSYADLIESDKAILHSRILNYNDRLFFVVTGNEKKGLFVLDVKTGGLLKKFENLYYELFQDDSLIYTSKFENILCKINGESFEVEEWNVNDLIKESGFESIHDHRCAVLENRFYFTQTLGNNKAKLGVLDWGKKELVYKYEFKQENGAISSIQVNDTRIFVHTQDSTLHIFEKE